MVGISHFVAAELPGCLIEGTAPEPGTEGTGMAFPACRSDDPADLSGYYGIRDLQAFTELTDRRKVKALLSQIHRNDMKLKGMWIKFS